MTVHSARATTPEETLPRCGELAQLARVRARASEQAADLAEGRPRATPAADLRDLRDAEKRLLDALVCAFLALLKIERGRPRRADRTEAPA